MIITPPLTHACIIKIKIAFGIFDHYFFLSSLKLEMSNRALQRFFLSHVNSMTVTEIFYVFTSLFLLSCLTMSGSPIPPRQFWSFLGWHKNAGYPVVTATLWTVGNMKMQRCLLIYIKFSLLLLLLFFILFFNAFHGNQTRLDFAFDKISRSNV